MDTPKIDTTTISPPTTPLSTHIKTLCVSSTTFRTDMCSLLSKTDFSDITVSDMTAKKVTKKVLVENLIKLTDTIESINTFLNPVLNCKTLSNMLNHVCNGNCDNIINNQSISDFNSQLATSSAIVDAVDKAMRKHTTEIEEKLSELYTVVSAAVDSEPIPLPNITNLNTSHTSNRQNIEVKHEETPTAGYDNNYISQSEINSIMSALSDCTFTEERGHSVCAFGEDYKYTGSKAAKFNEFPVPIKALVNKLNAQFYNSKEIINSCLVNRYAGDKACLPEHSDNESSIDPESNIYCVSIGADAAIIFRDIINGTETVQGCENGSLYRMTCDSQNFFTHRINEWDMGNEVRYSLTFRVVGWQYKNSTCIIGDSNTGKLKFGKGQGTFGYAMPGKRVWAATIDEIDPICCALYKNVVVLCGINNIKSRYIQNSDDIKGLYTSLMHKVDEIRLFNKKANIFVCPILPTKSAELNKRALEFNRYILHDLRQSCPGVSLVLGFDEFLDQDGYLAKDKSFTGDHLHLNMAGVRQLADLIKSSIASQKGRSGRVMKKPYSSAVSEGIGGARAPL